MDEIFAKELPNGVSDNLKKVWQKLGPLTVA